MLARPASGYWRPERNDSPDNNRSMVEDDGAGIGRGFSVPAVPNTFSSVRACQGLGLGRRKQQKHKE